MRTKTIGDNIYAGSVYGLTAWMIYAVVEQLFTSTLPWLTKPSHAYTPTHWGFTILLFLIYPVIGLTLGGLSGWNVNRITGKRLFRGQETHILLKLAASFSVILFFVLNICYTSLFSNYPVINMLPSFCISLLLMAGVILSSISSIWYGRLCFITNPWVAVIVLFGILPWVPFEPLAGQSKSVKAILSMVYPAAIFLISFFAYKIIYKITDRQNTDKAIKIVSTPPKSNIVFTASVFLIVFGSGLFYKQTPLQTDQNTAASFSDSSQPNIILITMDTVRADHLSLYGYERDTTPNLKRLSQEAILYKNAIATSNMTLPSHASIFTGLYTRSHGAHHVFETQNPADDRAGVFYDWAHNMPLDDKFSTIAEILSKKGYRTMAVVANQGYLGDSYRLTQGFQHYDYRTPVPFLGQFRGKVHPFYLRQSIHTFLSKFIHSSDYDMAFRNADEINDEVFTLLDETKKSERFFLFINYMDPHFPYTPPSPYDKLFPGKDETYTPGKFVEMEKQVMKLERKITGREQKHIVSQYDGGIAYVDFHIGELIKRLKKAGLYEKTVIIITSDHGEAFGERDFIQHENSVYQNEVYVPLLIRYPGTGQSKVVDEFVSGVDIMPTVLDFLGYEIPGNLQGISLLKPEHLNNRFVISESFSSRKKLKWHKRFYNIERAVFSGGMKLITSTLKKQELYDVSTDPNETTNIYSKNTDVAVDLEALLNQWLSDTKEESPYFKSSLSHKKIDKDTLDRLKALGYIQ